MIFAKNFASNSGKNNTLNIRCLVDDLFVPGTQHIILKYVGSLIPELLTCNANFNPLQPITK